jgi:acetylornithine/N-succinyldiaminopimelate aminotransferase
MIPESHQKYLVGNYSQPAIEVVRGLGSKVWDSSGKEYLDFTTGIAVNNLGHGHPHWVKSVSKQAQELVHCSNLFSIPEQVRLAKRLVERIGPGKVLFCNSGAEANEGMIKLARLFGNQNNKFKKSKIVCAENGFHGRTLGALSATSSAKYRNGFDPLLGKFAFAPLNDSNAFEKLMDQETAAVMVESIQGEGGIHVAEDSFLQKVAKLCNERNILLLLDEVQAGIGRTGEFLGFQKSGILPDAVAMAKGLGGGFPIGAIWISEKHADLFGPGSHGTTFGGSPLACSAAHAVLDVLERENLISASNKMGAHLKDKLSILLNQHPEICTEVRGRGLMLALALKFDPSILIQHLRENGLLVVGAGGHAIRFLPPLTVKEEEIETAMEIVKKTLLNFKTP